MGFIRRDYDIADLIKKKNFAKLRSIKSEEEEAAKR
jgi:hypothetical protein